MEHASVHIAYRNATGGRWLGALVRVSRAKLLDDLGGGGYPMHLQVHSGKISIFMDHRY